MRVPVQVGGLGGGGAGFGGEGEGGVVVAGGEGGGARGCGDGAEGEFDGEASFRFAIGVEEDEVLAVVAGGHSHGGVEGG